MKGSCWIFCTDLQSQELTADNWHYALFLSESNRINVFEMSFRVPFTKSRNRLHSLDYHINF